MSIRSLTTRVRPASGPEDAPSSGSSSQVIPAFQRSSGALTRDQRDGLDLDARAGDHEGRHLDEGRGGTGVTEDLLAHRVDERTVVDVREEDGHLDDVGEAAAGGRQDLAHVLEHGAGLRDDVVAAHELPVRVHGDDAADEEQLTRLDGVGEVGDRLGLTGDAELATGCHADRR